MARPKRDYLQSAHTLLYGWADWTLRNIKDAGYPHATVESRLMEGGAAENMPAGCRVPPGIMMPTHVAVVDRALRTMPEDLLIVVKVYYLDGEDMSRHRVNEALQWLAGKVAV